MAERILVVDDDTRHSALVSNYLKKQCFEIFMAVDGVDMQKQRAFSSFDLILLDVNMPGEDGLAICKRLRAEGDNTPIILLTARNELVDREVGLEIGADDYLAKPFDPRVLLAKMRAVLR